MDFVMKYRSEIDGLRALAVVPVILFHAGYDLFSGGFVGVDIFFVISGYLITKILIDEIENDTFSIINFYERRARRILPALFVMMAVCFPFAWMWMLPSQMKEFAYSLIAVSIFASNILFWQESGYFEAATEEKPLLHTWSLAVEEQYYFLFPLFLLAGWRFGKHRVFWMIVIMTVISLAISDWASRNYSSANFYLAPTRAWELLTGSIVAFIVQRYGAKRSNFMSLLGFFAVLFSIFFYDESTPFPSIYALVPVLGTASIILFAKEGTITAKILSMRLFVGIGLISYSAYLWHQPILAFAKIRGAVNPSEVPYGVLIIITLILAYFSWRYIEQPFRKRYTSRLIFSLSFFGILFFVLIGLGTLLIDGRVNPNLSQPPNIIWNTVRERMVTEGIPCNREQSILGEPTWLKGCNFGSLESSNNLVLLGDSHSQAISYEIEKTARLKGLKVFWLKIDGCEPVPYIRANKSLTILDCDDKFEYLTSYIKTLNADVVAINRWTFRMFPVEGLKLTMPYQNTEGFEEAGAGYREYDVYRNGQFYRDQTSKAAALSLYITKLADVSKRFFLVYSIPETAIDIRKLNWSYWNSNNRILDYISSPLSDYKKRNAFVSLVFNEIPHPNIIRIKPQDVFCNRSVIGRCDMQVNGVPLYIDDDHLNDEGAKLIINQLSTYWE
jgi:peptidoglycan/LPS O-acetylase OafA/YrhL